MTLSIPFFNIWAILVCFLINMVLGALWYSPILFGNQWLKLVGKTTEEISKGDSNKAMSFSIIPALIFIVTLSLLLALTGSETILDGIIVATLSVLGLIGMSSLNLVLFEGRSLKLTLLNVGYPLVSFNIAAVIIILWK